MVALLYVVESNGSSPGRQGFKMAVSKSGELLGSIGGGIMEHKLVELAKDKLSQNDQSILLKKQIHSDQVEKERSGMICSGEQTVCLLLLSHEQIEHIKLIINSCEQNHFNYLKISENGINLESMDNSSEQFSFTMTQDQWEYKEAIYFKNTIHILGSGHVGLALARQMKWLEFYVKVYDDRTELNTFEGNEFADEKNIIDYSNIDTQLSNESDYVVLVSFGYRTDKKILKQLLTRNFKYLGMMGSKSKTGTLMKALAEEGYSEQQLSKVQAPIGIDIQSKTPEEIAVSIAAQIITIKNKA
jgi:xanthine dehydrogenase accessory factor